MKNRKKAVFMTVAVIVVVFLAACSGKADSGLTAESGEMVVPEISSEDLLVTSLEYLLEDGKESQDFREQSTDEQGSQDTPEEPETVSQDTPEEPETISQDMPEDPGDEEEGQQKEKAVVYYGNGGSHDLQEETIEIEQITPDALISALARHNIVTLLDTKVLSFEEEESAGEKTIHLDLSKAFGEYLRTMSKEAECIIVSALANTFLENYDADGIYITVEGDALSTSNMEYTEALGRCTPDEVAQLMTE